MSKKSLILALSRGQWLVSDQYANAYLPLVSRFLAGEHVSFFDDVEEKNKAKLMPYAVFLSSGSSKTYSSYEDAPQGSIAIIPVNGPILKEDNCGAPGTATLSRRILEADQHPNIIGHVLDIDSGGGSVDGTYEFAKVIKGLTKPVVAFANGTVASAAYWIASGATEIIASGPTTQIGSIGTMVSWADYSGYYEKIGIKEVFIYADSSPDKNQTYHKALKGDTSPMRKESLNPLNDIFHAGVKENRLGKLNLATVAEGETPEPLTGKVYLANKAIEWGLADGIGDLSFAIQRAADLAAADDSTSHKSNQSNMKIKAAWTAMIAVLTAKFSGAKADDTITEEMAEEMNSQLGTLAQVKTDLAKAQEDLSAVRSSLATAEGRATTAEGSLATANTTISDLTKENNELKAKSAGSTDVTKKGTDDVGGDSKAEDFTCDTDLAVKKSREALYGK